MKRSEYDQLSDGASQTQMKKINAQLRAYFEDEVRYRLLREGIYDGFDYVIRIDMENGPEGTVKVKARDANACHGFGAPVIPEGDFTFTKAELFEAEEQPAFSR